MSDWPTLAVLIVTYKRTELALRTIRGVKAHLDYPGPVHWHVADDGSPNGHLGALLAELPESTTVSNAQRRGVGASMNLGMKACLEHGDLVLWLEDDWELEKPYDLKPTAQLLREDGSIGMVRLAYISPGIEGQLIAGAGRLWWRLRKGPTYTFTGHASLRHRRFCEAYGPYAEGLPAGETELYMCGTVNNRPGPDVVIPAWNGEWGPFAHIGGESLKDIQPGAGNGNG